MLKDATRATLELLKTSLSAPVEKATFNQPGSPTTGLQQYNLEKPAKRLYPVLTPLRNMIARNSGGFATAVNWKAVTGINTLRVPSGIAEGKRGGVIDVATAEYSAAFKALGLEANITFEAKYATKGYVDIKAEATMDLLDSFFLVEEEILIGGNNSIALGTPAAPAGIASAGDGTQTTTTRGAVVARVVALTHAGWYNSNRSDLTIGVATSAVRNNADGTTDTMKLGSSIRSAESASVSVTAGQKVTWTWADVRGARGYAIFTGVAGATKLLGYSTTNKFVQNADEGAGNQQTTTITSDNSQDSLVFDGVLTQVEKAGNNGYYRSLDGAKLTPDGKGGIVEFDTALRSFWDNYKLSPDTIWVSAEQYDDISKAIISMGTTPNVFSITMEGGQAGLVGGIAADAYLNRFAPGGAKRLQIKIHPNMVPGTILFWSNSLPYKLNGVPSIFQIEERQSYYAIEWPVTTRRWDFGVYVDEVLKCYAPFSCGVIKNIGSGLNAVP